jgi:Mg-chelatase subunit ChlD
MLMQDRSRRYRELPQHLEDRIAALPEDKRTYLEAGARILMRAHEAAASPQRRRDLAEQLADLLLKGEIAPEDRPELGEQAWQPDRDQQQQLAQALRDAIVQGEMDGPSKGTFGDKGVDANIAAAVQGAERDGTERITAEIVTNTGNAEVSVALTDLPPNQHATREAQARMARHVPYLAQKLKFRANRPDRLQTALPRGRIDDARLVEFPVAVHSGRRPLAFARRDILTAPEAAVSLLVDMSGSMSSQQKTAEFGSLCRSEMAMYAAALVDGALRQLKHRHGGGVDYAVFGHTTGGVASRITGAPCVVYRIVDPDRCPGPERIGGIYAGGGNYDGPALAAVADWTRKRWPNRQRLILFINDGLPNGDSYGGQPAFQAIRQHVEHLRKTGTQVLTIYLGDGGTASRDVPREDLATMYGPEGRGFIVAAELGQLPGIVGNVLAKVLKWQA